MMGYCHECRFWQTHAAWMIPDDDGDCKHPDPLWEAFGEGCSQEGITTKAQFGCVQFEAKGDK